MRFKKNMNCNIIKKITEKLISRIKNEEYKLADDIDIWDMTQIFVLKFVQMIRGRLVRIRIGGCGIIFCGKKTQLYHMRKISAGNNLILGDYVLIDALSKDGITFGNNVTIGRKVEIICTGVIRNIGKGLSTGNNVALGSGSRIAAQGGVIIGDDTIMGPNVVINAENHIFLDTTIPIRLQGEDRKGIKIGSNCWIGANVTILDGVSIGDGVVIGAGAVVTKDIEAGKMVAGVPARIVRTIGEG